MSKSRPGCPFCSIVSASEPQAPSSPVTPFYPTGAVRDPDMPDVIWKDQNFTAFVEKKNPISSKGHIIILFKLISINYSPHVPSIYSLSSTDVSLLAQLLQLAETLLRTRLPLQSQTPEPPFNVGFVTSPLSDPKIPVSDHLHAHAYIGSPDLAGLWRRLAYTSLGGWYDIKDLIAEIRETTSNNRIKSAYPNRRTAPIDKVPTAGTRAGGADGTERTDRGITRLPTAPPRQIIPG